MGWGALLVNEEVGGAPGPKFGRGRRERAWEGEVEEREQVGLRWAG